MYKTTPSLFRCNNPLNQARHVVRGNTYRLGSTALRRSEKLFPQSNPHKRWTSSASNNSQRTRLSLNIGAATTGFVASQVLFHSNVNARGCVMPEEPPHFTPPFNHSDCENEKLSKLKRTLMFSNSLDIKIQAYKELAEMYLQGDGRVKREILWHIFEYVDDRKSFGESFAEAHLYIEKSTKYLAFLKAIFSIRNGLFNTGFINSYFKKTKQLKDHSYKFRREIEQTTSHILNNNSVDICREACLNIIETCSSVLHMSPKVFAYFLQNKNKIPFLGTLSWMIKNSEKPFNKDAIELLEYAIETSRIVLSEKLNLDSFAKRTFQELLVNSVNISEKINNELFLCLVFLEKHECLPEVELKDYSVSKALKYAFKNLTVYEKWSIILGHRD